MAYKYLGRPCWLEFKDGGSAAVFAGWMQPGEVYDGLPEQDLQVQALIAAGRLAAVPAGKQAEKSAGADKTNKDKDKDNG